MWLFFFGLFLYKLRVWLRFIVLIDLDLGKIEVNFYEFLWEK